jgi:hypothetical protein
LLNLVATLLLLSFDTLPPPSASWLPWWRLGLLLLPLLLLLLVVVVMFDNKTAALGANLQIPCKLEPGAM